MKLSLNISPCPNDTFMFDAIVNSRIDLGRYSFDVAYHDIERLNALATDNAADISKISYATLPLIAEHYSLLDSGSALGYGNGPVFVSSRPDLDLSDKNLRVAIPGVHTTANLLLSKFYPSLTDKTPLLFSRIADAVADGSFDAGVLIHEGRFTFASHGLHLIADLGQKWECATHLPLPLGAIVASRGLGAQVAADIALLIRQSIEYAMAHPHASREFVKSHAQEMDDDVIDNHIRLFVGEYSLSLGADGRQAVEYLLGKSFER